MACTHEEEEDWKQSKKVHWLALIGDADITEVEVVAMPIDDEADDDDDDDEYECEEMSEGNSWEGVLADQGRVRTKGCSSTLYTESYKR